MSLDGKHAVVTGAGRGIGRAIAIELAKAGAELVLTSRTLSELEQVADEIREMGGDAHLIPTDISDTAQVDNLVKEAVAKCGTIEILVNNAGVFTSGYVGEMPSTDWMRVINTNLTGTFLITSGFLPHMVETAAKSGNGGIRKGGTIIMISSTSGKRGDPGSSAYAASKYGMIGFADSLRNEIRKKDIRVTVICPSSVDTTGDSVEATTLHAEDIAASVVDVCSLPQRAMIREFEVWTTNP